MAGTTDIIISYHVGCFRLDVSGAVGLRQHDYFSDTKLGPRSESAWHDLRSLAGSTKVG